MARDRIQWMRTVLLSSAEQLSREGSWQPLVDVYRTRDGWLVKWDLAGVRPEDVTLTVHGPRLTVRGVRRDWCLDDGCDHYRLEISYSQFERTIELPENLERTHLSTDYREGMLLVRLQKEAPR